MKRFFSLLAIMVATLSLAACSKGEESKNNSGGYTSISGTIVNMPSGDAKYTLKAVISREDLEETVATCDVAPGGSFKLVLPKTVDETWLEPFDPDEVPDNITISDPDAKMGLLDIVLYGNGERLDSLVFISFSAVPPAIIFNAAIPCYSNSKYTIKGSMVTNMEGADVSMDMDMYFVEGWNWMAASVSATIGPTGDGIGLTSAEGSASTKLPKGLQWYAGNMNDIMFK